MILYLYFTILMMLRTDNIHDDMRFAFVKNTVFIRGYLTIVVAVWCLSIVAVVVGVVVVVVVCSCCCCYYSLSLVGRRLRGHSQITLTEFVRLTAAVNILYFILFTYYST